MRLVKTFSYGILLLDMGWFVDVFELCRPCSFVCFFNFSSLFFLKNLGLYLRKLPLVPVVPLHKFEINRNITSIGIAMTLITQSERSLHCALSQERWGKGIKIWSWEDLDLYLFQWWYVEWRDHFAFEQIRGRLFSTLVWLFIFRFSHLVFFKSQD